MRRWAVVAALALPMLLAGCSGSSGLDARTGVSLSSSGEVELHYALCAGEHMSMIRVEELVGGSRTAYGVPSYWQVETEGAVVPGVVVVGSVPEGWTETVRYHGALPDDDLVGIEATRSGMGMSFRPARLREGEVLRGTYDTVSRDQFEADARAECEHMRRGALLAGLLAPLVAAGALVALWYLHRAQPETWTERQARRVCIWVVALCAGSFWTLTFFAVRNYEVHVVDVAVYAALIAIPAAILALLILPVAGGLGGLGRQLVPERARRWAAVACAVGAGALFWVAICGRDWRWLPLSVAISLGLVAMIPASQLRVHLPKGRATKVAAILVLSGCGLVSALGTGALLTNSPTRPTWDLADHGPAGDLEMPAVPGHRVLLDERRSGSDELSFEAVPGYRLFVACDDLSVQLSGGLGRGSVSYGVRAVVPCRVGEIVGPHSGRVDPGERLFLKVIAPPDVEWHIVAMAVD
jgi:hypothetical protein